MIARISSPTDYVTCTYSKDFLQIIKSVNNVKTNIFSKRIKYLKLPNENFEVGIKVDGDKVSCLFNGKVILSRDVKDMPTNGGIGFAVWDPSSPVSLTTDRIIISI